MCYVRLSGLQHSGQGTKILLSNMAGLRERELVVVWVRRNVRYEDALGDRVVGTYSSNLEMC